MANVHVTGNTASNFSGKISSLMKRRRSLRDRELNEIAQQHGWAGVDEFLREVVSAEIPPEVRAELDRQMAFREEVPKHWRTTVIQSLADASSSPSVKMCFIDEGYSRRAWAYVKYDTPDAQPYLPVNIKLSGRNPHYMLAMQMLGVYIRYERTHSYTVQQLTNFVTGRRTWGKVRRDWPELVPFAGDAVARRLGTTVARGRPTLSDEEKMFKEDVENMLTTCVLLPEYEEINTSTFHASVY